MVAKLSGILSAASQRFWSSLSGKYGNKFYWQDNGQEAAIVNAVSLGTFGTFEGCCRLRCVMCPAALLTCAKMSLLRRHTVCDVLSTG